MSRNLRVLQINFRHPDGRRIEIRSEIDVAEARRVAHESIDAFTNYMGLSPDSVDRIDDVAFADRVPLTVGGNAPVEGSQREGYVQPTGELLDEITGLIAEATGDDDE